MARAVKVRSSFGVANPEALEALLYGVTVSYGRHQVRSAEDWQALAEALVREPQYLCVVVPSANEVRTYLHCDAVVTMFAIPYLRRLRRGEVWWAATASQQLADRGARAYVLASSGDVLEL